MQLTACVESLEPNAFVFADQLRFVSLDNLFEHRYAERSFVKRASTED